MKVTKKRVVAVVGTTAALASITGVAVAVWSASGIGPGGAAATVAQGITITAVTPTGSGATLYPGGPASGIQFTVTNPNPYAVTLTGISYGAPTSSNPTACPNADITLDANAPKTVSISIPANSGPSSPITVPGVLDLAHTAGDPCQGVSFSIPVTLTGTQQ